MGHPEDATVAQAIAKGHTYETHKGIPGQLQCVMSMCDVAQQWAADS